MPMCFLICEGLKRQGGEGDEGKRESPGSHERRCGQLGGSGPAGEGRV